MVVRQLVETGRLTGETEQHEKGSCLFRAGEKIEYFFFIISGSVCLTTRTADTSLSVSVSQNFLLGLPDLMNENYSQSAVVNDTTGLIRIRRNELLEVLQDDPQLRIHLLKKLSRQTTLTKEAYE